MTKKSEKILSRSAFLHNKLTFVNIPELGGGVYLRELGGRGLLVFNERIEELKKSNSDITPALAMELMALLVSLSACNERGVLLFTPDDVMSLADMNFQVLLTVSMEAMKVSGIAASAVEEVAANLKNAQPVSSTTD